MSQLRSAACIPQRIREPKSEGQRLSELGARLTLLTGSPGWTTHGRSKGTLSPTGNQTLDPHTPSSPSSVWEQHPLYELNSHQGGKCKF